MLVDYEHWDIGPGSFFQRVNENLISSGNESFPGLIHVGLGRYLLNLLNSHLLMKNGTTVDIVRLSLNSYSTLHKFYDFLRDATDDFEAHGFGLKEGTTEYAAAAGRMDYLWRCYRIQRRIDERKFLPSFYRIHGHYGVCDDFDQPVRKWKLDTCKEPVFITFTEIRRDEQPESGGWRWHKWGPYIGEQKTNGCEYLYDEPHIERVYVFHVYMLNGEV